MSHPLEFVVFLFGEQRYALGSSAVDRVVQAVEIIRLPQAPEVVLGIINVQGRVVPVYNMRKRLGLPQRELQLRDQMIIARTARRTLAFVVDAVADLVSCTEGEIVSSETILTGLKQIRGILKLPDGLILVHDLEAFLSLDEEQSLDEALRGENAIE